MKSTMKKLFGLMAGATILATPVTACAAEDATATSAATSETASTAGATTPTAVKVQYVDAQNETINDARVLAAAASANKLAIVVWGGNRTIQQEAYNAARDLAGIGIPVAFVLAPDHNSLDGDAVMQVYAAGAPKNDSHVGVNNATDIRPYMRDAALVAYKEAFPQKVAALSVR